MKAITIIQPWATLIAIGEKKFETRSWATKHRGEIAIHAGKKIDKEACEAEPMRSVLAKHGYTVNNLPTGAVVALCNLSDCLSITNCERKIYGVGGDRLRYEIDSIPEIKGNELAFGWYETGRFAWEMTEVQRLTTPIPAKGQQGLWNWDSEGRGVTTSTRESKCGICNHNVPIDHEQIQRKEDDGTVTPYHMGCEVSAAKLKPCEDCGQHRSFCDDCAEPIWESGGTGE